MTRPRAWWEGLGPGDEMAPAELEPQGCECGDCAGIGTDEHGAPCERCDGSGETTGETSDGRAAASDLDAWHARLDCLDREHEVRR